MHFFAYTSLRFIFSNLLYHVHAYNIFLFPVEKKNYPDFTVELSNRESVKRGIRSNGMEMVRALFV